MALFEQAWIDSGEEMGIYEFFTKNLKLAAGQGSKNGIAFDMGGVWI